MATPSSTADRIYRPHGLLAPELSLNPGIICGPRALYNSNTEYTPIKSDWVDRILLQVPRNRVYNETLVFFRARHERKDTKHRDRDLIYPRSGHVKP